MNKKISDLTSWVNFNYLGLAAGILSVVVTVYNINQYWEEIRKAKKQVE
jgi:hypothetical protein